MFTEVLILNYCLVLSGIKMCSPRIPIQLKYLAITSFKEQKEKEKIFADFAFARDDMKFPAWTMILCHICK